MRHLPIAELELLVQHGVLRMVEPDAVIAAEREVARHLWLLLEGNAEQSMQQADGDDVLLSLLGRGDIFGEGGLFGARYRRTTVRATSRCSLLQFSFAALQPQLDQLSELHSSLRVRFRERLLQTTLARVPLLALLNPLERLAIAAQLDDIHVDREVEVMQAGGTSDGLFIVAEGQVKVVHRDRIVAVFGPGEIFGEMSLLDNAPHDASIVTLTPAHMLVVPRPTYESLLERHPEVAAGLRDLAFHRREVDRSSEHIDLVERMVDTGVVRGNHVLARDPQLCQPGCKRCVDACADRFEVPRLGFSGTMFGPHEVADSCRHCQWGAECAELCPYDAFRLDSAGNLVITDKCTGCGECVTACPYDAVNQVPIYPPATNPMQWLMRHTGRTQPERTIANKCDACSGYHDFACVDACPTGALQWIPVEQLFNDALRPQDLDAKAQRRKDF